MQTPSHIKSLLFLYTILATTFLLPLDCRALEPAEILVLANSSVKESVTLARYYLQARSIPMENLLILQTTGEESCSRATYDTEIRQPALQFLKQRMKTRRIRCLVTMYGIPLKIRPLQKTNDQATTKAAVDSELACILSNDYPLAGWQPNPYFLGFQRRKTLLKKDQVLMVSRLDGPDPATVRRIIADSVKTEKNGLKGRACIDARWPRPDGRKNLQGYKLYDASLYKTAELIRAQGSMEVRIDSSEQLFAPGDCPHTALYCGWYSLADYVDAFDWQPGAVGFHIASAECTTLKKKGSNVWCKRMLEEGIAATIGPVYEPFVQGFPLPDIFFYHLIEGYLTVAESYLISLPYLSWQMVLIGDPLYLPFKPVKNFNKILEKK